MEVEEETAEHYYTIRVISLSNAKVVVFNPLSSTLLPPSFLLPPCILTSLSPSLSLPLPPSPSLSLPLPPSPSLSLPLPPSLPPSLLSLSLRLSHFSFQIGISQKVTQYQFVGWTTQFLPPVSQFISFVCDVLKGVDTLQKKQKALVHDM